VNVYPFNLKNVLWGGLFPPLINGKMKQSQRDTSGLRPLVSRYGRGVPTYKITRLLIQTIWKPTG
jgi:hypothetical protein